jgi:hypothetical protein
MKEPFLDGGRQIRGKRYESGVAEMERGEEMF